MVVGELGILGVLLREVHLFAELFEFGVRHADHPGADVDGVNLGIREGVDPGDGAATN